MYDILQTASENMYKSRSNNEANYHNKAMHYCHTQTMQNTYGYFTIVKNRIVVLWITTIFNFICGYQQFGGNCYPDN